MSKRSPIFKWINAAAGILPVILINVKWGIVGICVQIVLWWLVRIKQFDYIAERYLEWRDVRDRLHGKAAGGRVGPWRPPDDSIPVRLSPAEVWVRTRSGMSDETLRRVFGTDAVIHIDDEESE